MGLTDILIYILLILSAFWAFKKHKLTLPGSITGLLIGLIIYKGAGLLTFILLTTFFVLGSWSTGWHKSEKAAGNSSPRTTGQVLANSGVAALLSAVAWLYP